MYLQAKPIAISLNSIEMGSKKTIATAQFQLTQCPLGTFMLDQSKTLDLTITAAR